MYKKLIYIFILSVGLTFSLTGQVKIRIFTGLNPEYILFNVKQGIYEFNTFSGMPFTVTPESLVLITKSNSKIIIKVRNTPAIKCDSVLITGKSGIDLFTLRKNDETGTGRFFSGDLFCLHDLNSIVLINSCDIESYVAGVVKAEGGSGKHAEYFKTQAVIVRTYMYRNLEKHVHDRYNLCDNTHCQVYNGTTTDTVILKATHSTAGEIILGPDSLPIIAAFHSNCGGETVPSEDVWLTGQPYLIKTADPFCLDSRNALWQTAFHISEWTGYLKGSGFPGINGDNSILNFSQKTRKANYIAGTFSIPLRQVREGMNLRSSFFSVTVSGDSVLLKGRGYGHGVGLCQEGAMVMATKGFDYKQIINFYYRGITISGDFLKPILTGEKNDLIP